jgi:serine/threonine protein kinase
MRLPKPLARTGNEPLGSSEAVLRFRDRLLAGGKASTTTIAAADVDGDGDLDVLLGNDGTPSRVLLNAGDGTFLTSIELPGGGAVTQSIAAADVDGDGDLDVLLGNFNSPSQLLINAGDGTFPTSIELPGGSAYTLSIAAADVDGDGDLDVLLGNFGDIDVLLGGDGSLSRVLLNAGDGTFPTSIELPGGAYTNSIAAADVDGDGDLDLLLGNDGSPSQLLLNAGGGTFPTSIELPDGSASTFSIVAADVDGDGDLDVLLGNFFSPSQLLLNAGDGTFPTSIELPGGSAFTTSIAAADVDGDGDLDVLLGNYFDPSRTLPISGDGTFNSPSRVLLNAGDGTFPTSVGLPVDCAFTRSIAAADVDGDGDLDVLLGNNDIIGNIDSPSRVLLNADGGTFPTSIELPGGSAYTLSIAAADVDGDGDLDVLLGNFNSPSQLLINAGDGTFPTSIELPGGSALTRSIAAADVDGDGDLDVLLGISYGSPSRVLLNAGDGTFPTSIELPGGSTSTTWMVELPGGTGTYSIAGADIDGDGDLDVLLGNNNKPSQLLINTGGGTFLTSIELPGGSAYTLSIAAADVDDDGDLDVLLGNLNSPSRVLLNAGDGTFPTSIELPGGSAYTNSIAAADVDGDGDLDLLLGNDGSPSQLLLNAGGGTFPTSIELPGGSAGTNSIAAADVDGDGDLDVLLGNFNSPSRVLLNAGDGTFPTSIELLSGGRALTRSIAVADMDADGNLDVLLGNDGTPSRLMPSIRCSQTGTARSRFGNGCVRCPAPSSRRDDHFDICYECEEHTELNGHGECSSCKPGNVRSLGASECTACPRGKRQGKAGTLCVDCSSGTYGKDDGLFGPKCSPCERGSFCPPGAAAPVPCHEGSSSSATDLERDDQCAPLTPRGMMVEPLEVAALASGFVLLLALLVAMARRRWRLRHPRKLTQPFGNNSLSMHPVSLWASERLSSLSTSSLASPSDEPTQLEVVDFSTLTMVRPIGKGGFATVWMARWQGTGLAVKVLHVANENFDGSALQEVAILRRLRHPCICALFGHMRVEQQPALVLEYMAGGSLSAFLFHPTPTPIGYVLSAPEFVKHLGFAVQLASGLCFLHSNGILHCDVKTDNALLDISFTVCKLADFGLARLSLSQVRRTGGDAGLPWGGGTLRYLAPEIVDANIASLERGDCSSVSSKHPALVSCADRTDVYAFALLLWELLHTRRAFEGMSGIDACLGARQRQRPTISLPPNHHGLADLMQECWAQRPEDRPNMSTMLERLEYCTPSHCVRSGTLPQSVISEDHAEASFSLPVLPSTTPLPPSSTPSPPSTTRSTAAPSNTDEIGEHLQRNLRFWGGLTTHQP